MKPMSPETSKRRKEEEEKKSNLETEIRKNTSHLYELAKSLSESSDQSCNANSDTSAESIKLINIDSPKKLENIDTTEEPKSVDS